MAGILKVLGITTNITVITISQASNRKQIQIKWFTEIIMKGRLEIWAGFWKPTSAAGANGV